MCSADDGVGFEPVIDAQLFSGSHVDEDEVSLSVHHEIFRFEVAVDELTVMEMLQHEQHLTDERGCECRG